MKYTELIQFDPIESVIQLTASNDANKATNLVKSYCSIRPTIALKCECGIILLKSNREE
jgi:hypothetical protein